MNKVPDAEVVILPVLSDNYAYLLVRAGQALVVDPSEAAPVRAALAACGASLSGILLTHYDADHTGGVGALRRETGCPVVGPEPAPWPLDTPLAWCIVT